MLSDDHTTGNLIRIGRERGEGHFLFTSGGKHCVETKFSDLEAPDVV